MKDCILYNDDILLFPNHNISLIDIDRIFKSSNIHFGKCLTDIGLSNNFDFSQKINKRLYTHSFLITLCDFIVICPSIYKMKFYSNTNTKDAFRNSLLKKVKSIFGFDILNGDTVFPDIAKKIFINDAGMISTLEIFFNTSTNPKSFKHIKRYLEKNGLKRLQDSYFQNITNKMKIMI